MLLGGVLCLSNLYVALSIGWSFGVTITAGILAFSLFTVAQRAGLTRREFSVLENNAMQSVASAAGYMTGGGTVAAIPALMMLTQSSMPWWQMLPWVTVLAMLGVVVAIPLKRQMIDSEQLRFPSGIAAAETLRSLHASAAEGLGKARLLGIAGLVAAVMKWFKEPPAMGFWPEWLKLPGHIDLPIMVRGKPIAEYTINLDLSLLHIGAGAIMGMRVAISQVLGAVLCWAVLAPLAVEKGWASGTGYKALITWTVWGGSSMLLTSGLLAFAFQYKTVLRAFRTLSGSVASTDPERDAQEVPMSWFLYGLAIFGSLTVVLQWAFFDIKPWMGILAVVMSLFIGIVAARSTGETDTTPTGALGKVTQLTFGALDPGSVKTNLMTANATGGVAIHAADLLTDLKSGWLLGANPRQQFFAQFFGVIAGAVFVVPAYQVMVPSWEDVGTKYPAPGAQSWAAVARVLSEGFDKLPTMAVEAMVIGGLLGMVLVLLEKLFPKHKAFIPSPMGLGLAFTMRASDSLALFVGALIAWMWQRKNSEQADRMIVPLSSGLIAGDSLMGVLLAFLAIAATMMGGK
jgi:uncharacterized oligopeptide transporter (OPT) family protein